MSKPNLNRNCWIAAAVLGLFVWLIAAGFGDMSLFEGLVLGFITTVLFGVFLIWITAGGEQYSEDLGPYELKQKTPLMDQAASSSGVDDRQSGPDHMAQVSSNGDAQLHDGGSKRPVSSRNDIYGKKAKPETAAKKSAATPVQDDKAVGDDNAATSDDLKEIKGVGPKLEELLHENGVTRFSQIAEWSDADIDHFAELIGRMGGRIRSDDWIEQARILTTGGETEFSKRVEQGGVYT